MAAGQKYKPGSRLTNITGMTIKLACVRRQPTNLLWCGLSTTTLVAVGHAKPINRSKTYLYPQGAGGNATG